jgi:nucleotide-binding universal stress UspA family protein
MFKKIVVPLDGSKLAEQALPYAESLANAYGATLIFVRVIPRFSTPAAPLNVAAVDKQLEDEAATYLEAIHARVSAGGIPVETHNVVSESASEALLSVAHEQGAELIVGVSNGRSGIARTIFGSTIDDLVRDPGQPVMVINGVDVDED